ncbi:MAG: DUF4249 family protein [Bacteroidia bacterium]
MLSCNHYVLIDVGLHEPKIVINAIQHIGQPFYVHVSRSYQSYNPALGDTLFIDDARVEIWENGSLLSSLDYRDTLYSAQTNPFTAPSSKYFSHYESPADILVQEDRTYELRVFHDEYDDITAIITTPIIPKLDTPNVLFGLVSVSDIDGTDRRFDIIEVDIKDPAGSENWYSLDIDVVRTFPFDTMRLDTSQAIGVSVVSQYSPGQLIFTGSYLSNDVGRNGQNFTLNFGINSRLIYSGGSLSTVLYPNEITFRLNTYERSAAAFFKGIEDQRQASGTNPFLGPEALEIPSNIDGGYGVFGAMSIYEVRKEY